MKYSDIKAILMTRVYSNKNNWLLTLSGRHPENTFKISDEVFRYAAFGKETGVDKELAEAYLRLTPTGKYAEEFKKLGFNSDMQLLEKKQELTKNLLKHI